MVYNHSHWTIKQSLMIDWKPSQRTRCPIYTWEGIMFLKEHLILRNRVIGYWNLLDRSLLNQISIIVHRQLKSQIILLFIFKHQLSFRIIWGLTIFSWVSGEELCKKLAMRSRCKKILSSNTNLTMPPLKDKNFNSKNKSEITKTPI